MLRIQFTTTIFLIFYGVFSGAAEVQKITLKDGSVLSGEVLALDAGSYRIQTQSMGVLHIKQAQVRSIQALGDAPGQVNFDARQFQSLQSSIAANPQMMQSILSLRNDPAFQAVIKDPQVLDALQSGDFSTLMNNPKIQQLTTHPAVKGLSRDIQ